jgi:hypothetical protein
MTGLWTTDRDTLNQGVSAWLAFGHDAEAAGDYLVNTGWVRVLDPDDTELVERVAATLRQAAGGWAASASSSPNWPTSDCEIARAVIEVLRQP